MIRKLYYKLKLYFIDLHNRINEYKISRQDEKELVRITKQYIKSCKKINNNYNKNNLITK